jgi:hypothetical protein
MQRFEGVSFSTSGDLLGIATADTNSILLFRRKIDGRFDPNPFLSLGGPGSGIDYPHDLSFSRRGETELLAVAQRAGAIAIYQGDQSGHFSADPIQEISGPEAKLDYSDGVAFVPPHEDHLAACNLQLGTVTFFGGCLAHHCTSMLFLISSYDTLAFVPLTDWPSHVVVGGWRPPITGIIQSASSNAAANYSRAEYCDTAPSRWQ